MKVAVYSGSFNPMHTGHKAIIEYLTDKMHFDKVYLVVSPKNPLKSTVSEETASERFENARKAVDRHGLNVYLDDIELHMPSPQYTVRTLEAMKIREPENDFTFVMGADSLGSVRKWKEYQKILTEFGVVVYPRKGYDLDAIISSLKHESPDYKITVADAQMIDISSSEIRDSIEKGIDISSYLL